MFTNHNIKDIFEKKVENESRKREKILLEKLDWYLFDLLVTRHFQLCIKNYCFPLLAFLSYFSYFVTFHFQVFIQQELN